MSDKKIEQRCGKQPVGAADAILYHSRYTKVIIFIGEIFRRFESVVLLKIAKKRKISMFRNNAIRWRA